MAGRAGGHGGRRESQWLVMRRCLAILRRVQRGTATRAELLAAVRAEVGAEAYAEGDAGAARKRLEKDLERIRAHLLIDLYYDRRAGGYTIRDTWLPLLDLPDQDLGTMAWLEKTFDAASPQHEAVQALLQHLRQLLAPERLGLLERLQRGGPALDLACRDEDSIPPEVWETLRRALVQRRRIAFHYLSPQRADGAPRLHVVDPWECYFDPARGHYYLRGWCYETGEGSSREVRERYVYYRLGRMRNLQVRPEKLPPQPPPARRYAVAYELAAHVA
ncbi:MAG: helix-turn-helix transcriptional regulator, partial [Anaerolineae bacterium]